MALGPPPPPLRAPVIDENKTCISCRWRKRKSTFLYGFGGQFCANPKSTRKTFDPVNGNKAVVEYLCSVERDTMRGCGPEGKWWEKKP